MHRRLLARTSPTSTRRRSLYALLFTHPTPPERIAAARARWPDEPRPRARPFPRASRRALTIALGLIVALMAGEIVFGVIAGSLALIADAGHMLTDAAALGARARRRGLAQKPARGRVDVRLPPARDPRRAHQRDHAARRRGRDRLHRRLAADSTRRRCAAGSSSSSRSPDRREPGRALAAAPAEPREPERPRRLPARRDRPRCVHGHRDRRRPDPRDRLGPFRPDREPRRRRAHLLVELRAAARVDADPARRGPRRAARDRGRDAGRAACLRRARPPRLDGRQRLPRRSRHTSSSSRARTATRSASSSRACWPTASAWAIRLFRSSTRPGRYETKPRSRSSLHAGAEAARHTPS